MKKVSLILAALALVLGISQCKKQEEPVASGEKQHIVLNASFGGGNSKIADNGTGGLIWSLNDVIKVSNMGRELGELHCTDTAKGTFEGEISESSGTITFKFGSIINYLQQTGELNEAISLTAEAPYDKDGNYSVTMNMMDRAVVKLDLSKILTEVGQKVDFSTQNGMGVSLIIAREDFESPFYVAIPAPTKIVKVDNIAVDWNLEPNSFYTAKGEGDDPTGDAIVINPTYEVLISETFEDYTVGNKIASEAAAASNNWWTTWSSNPGSVEDGIVDEFQGAKCGHLTYNNDQVLLLGDKESGIYDLEFDILVPQGKNGYFNILHNFNGVNSTWAMQCYLHLTNDGQTSTDAPNHGTIHAGSNSTADVTCVYDAWMHFRLHVDTDNDRAEYYYTAPGESEVLVCNWQWSLDSFGENNEGKKLSAMDFFPPEDAATSEFYLDNFSFKKIK